MKSNNGSPCTIGSQSDYQEVAATTLETTTQAIEVSGARRASVIVPTGSTITSIAYYGSYQAIGVFVPIQDGSGAVVDTVAAAKGYSLPVECLDYLFIKMVCNVDGTLYLTQKG